MAYTTVDEIERAYADQPEGKLYAVRLMDGWHAVTAKQTKEYPFKGHATLPLGTTAQRTTR